jgi:hypothetical protein
MKSRADHKRYADDAKHRLSYKDADEVALGKAHSTPPKTLALERFLRTIHRFRAPNNDWTDCIKRSRQAVRFCLNR